MNKFRKKKDVVWDVAISRRALDDTRPHPLTKVPLRRRICAWYRLYSSLNTPFSNLPTLFMCSDRFSMGSLGHQHPKIYRHIFYATKETERRENISLLPIQHLELTREPIESDIKFTVRIPAKALVATSPNEFSVVHHLRHVGTAIF